MRIVRYTYPNIRNQALGPGLAFRNPWAGLESEMDQFFDAALSSLARAQTNNRFPVDLYEDKENTYVRAELPGVNKDDIGIEFVDGFLTIQTSRKQKTGNSEESFALNRSVMVSNDVQADKVSASYENGLLTVTLPKKEESKPRKISVSVN
ncbi:MAG: Hsp20/alpha crystallin family protein [Opitutaceae bacterium]|jgi:HSP20 family protein